MSEVDPVYSPGADVPPVDSVSSVVEVVESGPVVVVDVSSPGADVGVVQSPGSSVVQVDPIGLGFDAAMAILDLVYAAISNIEVNPYKVFDAAWSKCLGDAVRVPLTGTYKQVGYGVIPRDAWRDSGFLLVLCQIDAAESNVAGGACSIAFSLRSSPMPAEDGTYAATTQHMEKTYSFAFLANDTASFALETKINVSGSISDVWSQKATGLLWLDIGGIIGADPIVQSFSPTFDPTERRFFHLFAKATLSGTQTATAIYGRCLLFNPRSGTCYAF